MPAKVISRGIFSSRTILPAIFESLRTARRTISASDRARHLEESEPESIINWKMVLAMSLCLFTMVPMLKASAICNRCCWPTCATVLRMPKSLAVRHERMLPSEVPVSATNASALLTPASSSTSISPASPTITSQLGHLRMSSSARVALLSMTVKWRPLGAKPSIISTVFPPPATSTRWMSNIVFPVRRASSD